LVGINVEGDPNISFQFPGLLTVKISRFALNPPSLKTTAETSIWVTAVVDYKLPIKAGQSLHDRILLFIESNSLDFSAF